MPKKENSGNSFNKKRRKLLKLLGLSSAFFAGKSVSAQVRINRATDQQVSANLLPAFISISLLRPEDLLSLELRYYNFSLTNNILQKKGNPAYLVVIFQPQSMSEQAWEEEENKFETPSVPGKILIGGESRLVFQMPPGISSIPLNVNDLMAWEKYELLTYDPLKPNPNPGGTSFASLPMKERLVFADVYEVNT